MSGRCRRVGDANVNARHRRVNANTRHRRVAKKGCVLTTRDYERQMRTVGVEGMGDYQP